MTGTSKLFNGKQSWIPSVTSIFDPCNRFPSLFRRYLIILALILMITDTRYCHQCLGKSQKCFITFLALVSNSVFHWKTNRLVVTIFVLTLNGSTVVCLSTIHFPLSTVSSCIKWGGDLGQFNGFLRKFTVNVQILAVESKSTKLNFLRSFFYCTISCHISIT